MFNGISRKYFAERVAAFQLPLLGSDPRQIRILIGNFDGNRNSQNQFLVAEAGTGTLRIFKLKKDHFELVTTTSVLKPLQTAISLHGDLSDSMIEWDDLIAADLEGTGQSSIVALPRFRPCSRPMRKLECQNRQTACYAESWESLIFDANREGVIQSELESCTDSIVIFKLNPHENIIELSKEASTTLVDVNHAVETAPPVINVFDPSIVRNKLVAGRFDGPNFSEARPESFLLLQSNGTIIKYELRRSYEGSALWRLQDQDGSQRPWNSVLTGDFEGNGDLTVLALQVDGALKGYQYKQGPNQGYFRSELLVFDTGLAMPHPPEDATHYENSPYRHSLRPMAVGNFGLGTGRRRQALLVIDLDRLEIYDFFAGTSPQRELIDPFH